MEANRFVVAVLHRLVRDDGSQSWFVGYCGLGASVASLGLATSDPVKVDLVVCPRLCATQASERC